ncbi:hypothetical protein [Evansella cellulosilytica]|uniref:Uncharacterized protein n=1 Tax=Evansella cellulosilytica (strain ATCC 21833 / DSM 2522 / FERM P-1141 / JCM 9156 / N-4) TaxID=649639 RepID=E6TUJ6_EVAC2|nr:hypothetical protein [Evansella cellulosilytica]ADU30886.1 hypothetical protein Bcell_2629 [Evansella cellulosilytica DSM 2522]
MGFLNLFYKRSKRTENITDFSNNPVTKLEFVSVDPKSEYENGRIEEAKFLLEDYVFNLKSDCIEHYELLLEIYEDEENGEGMTKLQKFLEEQVLSNSKMKHLFAQLVIDIDFKKALRKYALKVQFILEEHGGISKTQLVELIRITEGLDNCKANQVYKYAVNNHYILRKKINSTYLHFKTKDVRKEAEVGTKG